MARTLVMMIEVDEEKTEITDHTELMVEFMKVIDGRVDAPGVFKGSPIWMGVGIDKASIGVHLLTQFDDATVTAHPEKTSPITETPMPVTTPQFSLPTGPVFLKDLW